MKFKDILYPLASNFGVVSSFALVAFTSHSFAAALEELSEADQQKVKNGEQVSVFTNSGIPDAPWPICKVYQKVSATPLETTAAFSDFELQSTYIPGLTKSRVVAHKGNVLDISYQLTFPMGFGVEDYVAHDTIASYNEGASFKVDWTIYPTASIKESHGNARFEPLGDGTLIVYENFIFPLRWGSNLGWVVERSKKQVKDTVTAIINQISKEKQSNPELLKNQIQNLQEILASQHSVWFEENK